MSVLLPTVVNIATKLSIAADVFDTYNYLNRLFRAKALPSFMRKFVTQHKNTIWNFT